MSAEHGSVRMMSTHELTSVDLDHAVAIANGWVTFPDDHEGCANWYMNAGQAPFGGRIAKEYYCPTRNAEQAFRVIEDNSIAVQKISVAVWEATKGAAKSCGPSFVMAALRCYVIHQVGMLSSCQSSPHLNQLFGYQHDINS